MPPSSNQDPAGRFTGLSDLYARHRPSYPDAALDYLVSRCGLSPGKVLIDVGCGTGISSRQMAMRGLRVLGLDPNAEMLTRAAAESVPAGVIAPEYRDGRAEATGLPAASADAVLAAQAFHWFQPAAALHEFHRILKPGGWIALVWNERDESDAFTAAYGAVLRALPETAAVEGPRGQAGNVLLECPLFVEAERVPFPHSQELDEDGLLGRAISASYTPKEPPRASIFAAELRRVFAGYQRQGRVVLCYVTTVYLAQRPAEEVPS